jgi:hypothetical protein
MRYRFCKEQKEDEVLLNVAVWAQPFSYDATPQEQIEMKAFPFSEEGIVESVDWLNERWKSEEPRWTEANDKWK